MSSLDLTVILFALMTFLNYRVSRSVLYPPFLFCMMFLLALFIFQTDWIEIDPLHENTLAILAGGTATFCIGGFLASLVPKSLMRLHIFPPDPKNGLKPLRNILTSLLICGLPMLGYEVWQLSKAGPGGSLLMSARQAQVDAINNGAQVHSFVLDYFLALATFTVLAYAVEKRDRHFWIATVVTFIACILSTGRVSLLVLIAGLCTISLLQAKRESFFTALKLTRWPVAIFIFMYILLIFTNKNTDDFAGGHVGDVAVFFLLGYIAGPLAAFDIVVQHPSDFMPLHTQVFDFFAKAAAALHLVSKVDTPRFDDFVLVPFPANAYTVFKFYFLELGIGGTLCALFLIGFVHSLLYFKAREGGHFSIYLFSITICAAIMVPFNDNYSLLGNYLKAVLFGLAYFTVRASNVRLSWHPSIQTNFVWRLGKLRRRTVFSLMPSSRMTFSFFPRRHPSSAPLLDAPLNETQDHGRV